MKQTLRAYMQLVRLPNCFTAVADATAGIILARAAWASWADWYLLGPASFLLYAGGVALNDVCDAGRDRVERPERPIPSGRITRRTAAGLAAGCLIAGIGCAAACGPRAGIVALLLTCAIGLYNAALKTTPLAPAIMGLCRALNLALGMYVLMPPDTLPAALPVAIMWLYVTSLTGFARKESTGGSALRLSAATAGMLTAIAAIVLVRPFDGDHRAFHVACVIALGAYVAWPGWLAARVKTPGATQHAVKRFVLAIVLVDACLAWTGGGLLGAVIVAVWLIPAMLLARTTRVT